MKEDHTSWFCKLQEAELDLVRTGLLLKRVSADLKESKTKSPQPFTIVKPIQEPYIKRLVHQAEEHLQL